MDCGSDKVLMKNLYVSLTAKRKAIKLTSPIFLSQKDFNDGTYLIDKSGYYVLKENIVFNPNPNDDYMPRTDQAKYKTPGFSSPNRCFPTPRQTCCFCSLTGSMRAPPTMR